MSNESIQPTRMSFELVLAKKLAISALYIKHEEENPSGSHKDRSIWPMMDHYIAQGKTSFVISSSGNAAISAAYYVVRSGRGVLQYAPTLRIFISTHVDPTKKTRLDQVITGNRNITIQESDRPKQSAFRYAKEHSAVFLRASQDDHALMGYETLARELIEQAPDMGSIFIPTSSGTCALGLYRCLLNSQLTTHNSQLPEFHIVQTTKIHPIALGFDKDFVKTESSLATAIVDNVAHRKKEVIKVVKESGGSGWVISDEELGHAHALYESVHPHPSLSLSRERDMISSPPSKGERKREGVSSFDSLLSLAGLMKALKHGWKFEKPVVLLFTGK